MCSSKQFLALFLWLLIKTFFTRNHLSSRFSSSQFSFLFFSTVASHLTLSFYPVCMHLVDILAFNLFSSLCSTFYHDNHHHLIFSLNTAAIKTAMLHFFTEYFISFVGCYSLLKHQAHAAGCDAKVFFSSSLKNWGLKWNEMRGD